MAFNFPTDPVQDQVYVTATGMVYTWNGYAWMLTDGGIAPPTDYVEVAGDTMTGSLILPARRPTPMKR